MVLASVACTDAGPAGSEGTGEGHRASGARYHRWVLVLVDERYIGGGEGSRVGVVALVLIDELQVAP